MLYDLIQTRNGKQTIVMTGELSKVNNRMKTLRKSQRKGIKGQRVEYSINPTTITEKFKQAPHDICLSGDGKYSGQPKRVKNA